MTTLYSYRSQGNVSLQKAIQDCSSVIQKDGTVALLYATNWCKFGKLVDGVLQSSDGQPIKLDAVYEARIFNKDAELRWVKAGKDMGSAILISEAEQKIGNFVLQGDITPHKILDKNHSYLLWGEAVVVPNDANHVLVKGWSRFTTARIGEIDVPLGGQSARVRIRAVEYLNIVDDHGNVSVIEERLVALEEAK